MNYCYEVWLEADVDINLSRLADIVIEYWDEIQNDDMTSEDIIEEILDIQEVNFMKLFKIEIVTADNKTHLEFSSGETEIDAIDKVYETYTKQNKEIIDIKVVK